MVRKLLTLLMDFVLNALKKSEKVKPPEKEVKMELKLIRKRLYKDSTIGELLIDGYFECYTLEDEVRPPGEKVPGETAISAGTYKLVIDKSDRFKCLMPHLLDVPMFTGVRIHSGNTDQDTEGCILVGSTIVNENFIGNSKVAFDQLFSKLKLTFDLGEEIRITIE